MIVTSIDRLIAFWQKHSDARKALTTWLQVARAAHRQNLLEIRRAYAKTADSVMVESGRIVTVFNIRGNTYRLITAIDYRIGAVNVLDVLTHAEYDKEKWKKTL